MSATRYPADEVIARGCDIYEREIRPRVETKHHGEYLVINVETGEYELDADDVTASRRAKVRFPDAPLFAMRVGHPTAYRLGGHFVGRSA